MIEFKAEISVGSDNNLGCWTKITHSLAKVGEYINFDVSEDEISLTAYNPSRSVFASSKFTRRFFKGYSYTRQSKLHILRTGEIRLTSKHPSNSHTIFQLQSKTLISIFRHIDRDNNVKLCRLSFVDREQGHEDEDNDHVGSTSKLEIEINCGNGIKRSYHIACMDTQQVYQIVVDKEKCPNWIICDSLLIKGYMELMSQKAEIFEMKFFKENVQLSSYTTGIYSSENTMLKQPIHTKVKLGIDQIERLEVEENISIGIRLKEFRIFINLLDSLMSHSLFEANFYQPGYPILFQLSNELPGNGMLPLPKYGGEQSRSLPLGAEVAFIFLSTGSIGIQDSMLDSVSSSNTISNSNIIRRGIRPGTSSIRDEFPIRSRTRLSAQISTANTTQIDSFNQHQQQQQQDEGLEFPEHQPSVMWDVDEEGDQIMNPHNPMQPQPQPRPPQQATDTESSLFVYQEDEEEEARLDAELLSFATQVESIGATQNKSQAKGIFD